MRDDGTFCDAGERLRDERASFSFVIVVMFIYVVRWLAMTSQTNVETKNCGVVRLRTRYTILQNLNEYEICARYDFNNEVKNDNLLPELVE